MVGSSRGSGRMGSGSFMVQRGVSLVPVCCEALTYNLHSLHAPPLVERWENEAFCTSVITCILRRCSWCRQEKSHATVASSRVSGLGYLGRWRLSQNSLASLQHWELAYVDDVESKQLLQNIHLLESFMRWSWWLLMATTVTVLSQQLEVWSCITRGVQIQSGGSSLEEWL